VETPIVIAWSQVMYIAVAILTWCCPVTEISSDGPSRIGVTPICKGVVSHTLPSAWGYIWATLFLGDINTETWPSRLGESEMRQ
jgi:hypothetical protein